MFSFQNNILFLSILLSGLLAGLLYGYSCSVNNGLKALTDDGYLKAMQAINIVIQNPYFFISFMGSILFLPLSTWHSYMQQNSAHFYLLLSATLIYIIGVFGVTLLGNVPLNNQLAKFNIDLSSETEIKAMRMTFESAWNRFHLVRTLCAIFSFALTLLAILKNRL